MPALSATTLKLFQECPRCFWLHVNQRIERPRGPFPSLPSGIDRILKVYFDDYRESSALPPLIAGKLDGKLSTQSLTIGFTDPETGFRLWGKLDDCVVFDDNSLAPLDHKTRASSPSNIGYSERYYKLQMDVYTLLLEQNGKATKKCAYLIYYFPIEGTLHKGFPFDVTVHKIKTEPDKIYELFRKACRCLQATLPQPNARCGFCRWLGQRMSFSENDATQSIWRPAASKAKSKSQRKEVFRSRNVKASPVEQETIPEDLFV